MRTDLIDSPGEVGRWLTVPRRTSAVHWGIPGYGEADVEVQSLDAARHLVERAMGGLRQGHRFGAESAGRAFGAPLRCRPIISQPP